jgi:hypothetical protein
MLIHPPVKETVRLQEQTSLGEGGNAASWLLRASPINAHALSGQNQQNCQSQLPLMFLLILMHRLNSSQLLTPVGILHC